MVTNQYLGRASFGEPIRKEVIDAMLAPYYPQCRYLKKAELDFPRMRSQFSINETIYAPHDTGHFNAIEALMCYNQMSFVFFASALEKGLIETARAVSLEKFTEYQVKSCLLAKIGNIKFRSFINAEEFTGEIELRKIPKRKNNHFATTDFRFYDKDGGRAEGDAMLVLSI